MLQCIVSLFIFTRTLSSLHPYFTDELPIANEGLGHDLTSGRSLCFSSHTTTTRHSPDRFSRLLIAPLPLQANCSLSSLKSAVWHPLGWLCRDLWRLFRILNYHSSVAFLSVLVLWMWKSLRINPPLADWRETGTYHAKVKAQAWVKETWIWILHLSHISLRNVSRCLTSRNLCVLICRRELIPLPLFEGLMGSIWSTKPIAWHIINTRIMAVQGRLQRIKEGNYPKL